MHNETPETPEAPEEVVEITADDFFAELEDGETLFAEDGDLEDTNSFVMYTSGGGRSVINLTDRENESLASLLEAGGISWAPSTQFFIDGSPADLGEPVPQGAVVTSFGVSKAG